MIARAVLTLLACVAMLARAAGVVNAQAAGTRQDAAVHGGPAARPEVAPQAADAPASPPAGSQPAAPATNPAAPAATQHVTAPAVDAPVVAPQAASLAPHAADAEAPVERNADPGAGPRIELSLLAVPFGAGAGALACALAECSEVRGIAGAILGGAAITAATAALTTRGRYLEYATAQAIEGGAFWGLTTPVYIWLLASPSDGEVQGLFAGMLFGEVLGGVLGGLAERSLRPSSGAVALANSGGLWLSAITTLSVFASEPYFSTDASVRGMGGGLLAAQLLGLGIGGLAGQRFAARRTQVWLADVGAVLVGGVMPLFAWLVAGEGISPAAILGTSAVGLGVGFVGTYALAEFLPRKRKQRALEKAAAFGERFTLGALPLRGGGGLQLRATSY